MRVYMIGARLVSIRGPWRDSVMYVFAEMTLTHCDQDKIDNILQTIFLKFAQL